MQKKLFLLFALVFILLCTVLVSCGKDPPATSLESTEETVPHSTTDSLPNTTVDRQPTTKAPEMLVYTEQTVSFDGFISVPSDSYISGSLLHIDEENPYRYNLTSLPFSNKFSSATQTVKAQNLMILYGNKSKDYLLASSSIFMKSEAFPHWEALVSAFKEVSGKTSLQVVNGYFYTAEEGVSNEFVTGYCVAVNLFENGSTYSLASRDTAFTLDGETVTCLSWFIDNCAKYGFVYTGLTGDQYKTLATFRYVGAPHAAIMKYYDIIDFKIYSNVIKDHSPAFQYLDEETGINWTVIHVPKSEDYDYTRITLPIGAVYTVSGNNFDGFIVAYHTAPRS